MAVLASRRTPSWTGCSTGAMTWPWTWRCPLRSCSIVASDPSIWEPMPPRPPARSRQRTGSRRRIRRCLRCPCRPPSRRRQRPLGQRCRRHRTQVRTRRGRRNRGTSPSMTTPGRTSIPSRTPVTMSTSRSSASASVFTTRGRTRGRTRSIASSCRTRKSPTARTTSPRSRPRTAPSAGTRPPWRARCVSSPSGATAV